MATRRTASEQTQSKSQRRKNVREHSKTRNHSTADVREAATLNDATTMENSYGIGITNRYAMFYMQDEAGDPLETLVKKKAKTQKTKLATTGE